MSSLTNLPATILDLFKENFSSGQYVGSFYSATDASEVERALEEHGVSYRTKIIRSRKKGVYYLITLLEEESAYA
jgi:hypothetical protein